MSRRKPLIKPMDEAIDAVVWRARIVCEFLEGLDKCDPPVISEQTATSLHKLEHALEDYDASKQVRMGGGGANGHAPHQIAKSDQLELQP